MQINNDALSKLLSGSDDELEKVITAAAKEGGVPLPVISAADIAKLRAALCSLGSTPEAMNNLLRSAEMKKRNGH